MLPNRETSARQLRYLALLAVLTALYTALGRMTWEWLTIRLPEQPAFPLLWPSTGFAFAVLALGGRRFWPVVTVGSLILTAGLLPWPLVFLVSFGNTLEALVAVHWVLGSSRRRPGFRSLEGLWRFLARACWLPPWISAVFGTLAWWLLAPSSTFAELFQIHWRWWLTNATGLLVVAPPLLTWLGPRFAVEDGTPDQAITGETVHRGEAALALALGLIVAVIAFGGSLDGTLVALWPPFTTIPFSLWASLRHGPREATTLSLIFTVVAGWGTARGYGPFSAATGLESAGIFWPFVVSMTVITLVMSVLLREQRRSEAERQAGLELLEGIVDNLPALVSVRDEQGRNLFVNRAMVEAYDQSPEELLGRTAAETIGGTIGPEITELDRRVVSEASGDPAETNSPRRLEIQEPSPTEGRSRHYLTTKHLLSASVPKRLLTIAFDITDLKTAQAARERSESQLRSVLENIDGWVLTTDLSGTLFFANRSFPETELKDMIASSVSSFVHSGDRYTLDDAIDRTVAEGRRQTLEVRAAWGQQPWLECRISPVLHGDDVHELMITLVDVEDRRQAEAERSRLREQMQKMHNLESLGALAGGIAHDFNNLLTAVLGNAARAAADVAEDSKVHRNLQRIEGAAERAAELCQQMLDFAGKARIEKSPRDLSDLVHSMVEAVRGALPESVHLDLALGDGLSPVLCDPTQIRRIVMNLITNAADALEARPGTVRISTAERHLGRRELSAIQLGRDLEPGPYVVLEVQDEGCGMPREVRDQIFQPFFTTKFAGRGLGLAAVGGTMRGHGGGIVVASEPGVGTTFTLLFRPTEGLAESEPEEHRSPAPTSPGGLILVADDQDVVRELARASLEEAGFTVVVANDGLEARQKILEHRQSLRLAVLDHSMPGASGLEVMRDIAAEGIELPCLLSSGFDPTKLGDEEETATEVAFLRKPYRPADLIREVRRALVAEPRDGS